MPYFKFLLLSLVLSACGGGSGSHKDIGKLVVPAPINDIPIAQDGVAPSVLLHCRQRGTVIERRDSAKPAHGRHNASDQ